MSKFVSRIDKLEEKLNKLPIQSETSSDNRSDLTGSWLGNELASSCAVVSRKAVPTTIAMRILNACALKNFAVLGLYKTVKLLNQKKRFLPLLLLP